MLSIYNKTYNIERTLYPKLFSLIKAIPDKYLFFEAYENLKHPGSILLRSTEEIVVSTNKVIQQHHNILAKEWIKENNENELREFLNELQTLILHFDSFQDECYLQLKGLCPPPKNDNAPYEKFVHEWLNRNDFSCASKFLGYTGNIQKYIDLFSNRFKHGNQRFEYVSTKTENFRIDGIFIEELKGKEVKEVYPWLPSRMEPAAVAFSINYFLKTLLLCFYEIAYGLEMTIKAHIKEIHRDAIRILNDEKHTESFERMVLGVSDLPNVFYPYEYKKQPKISRSGKEIKLSYPHGDKMPYRQSLAVSVPLHYDGYTKKHSLPFFG